MVGGKDRGRGVLGPAPETGWRLLGGMGLVFAVVALADLALAWYPANFGNAEWEFGTVTAVLGGLPLLAMGVALLFGAAVARGQEGKLRVVSIVLALFAVLILAMLGLYVRRIPAALAGVTQPEIGEGLREAIVKTVLQGLLYPAAFLWMSVKGWKHVSSG
jgi:hypothetical protein